MPILIQIPRACAILCPIVLAIVGCNEFEIPPRIASSQYIDYHTDADASVICIDDLLEREDRFIERTAALLGVDPPSGTIDYVWDPVQDGSEPWACPPDASACYMHRDKDGLSVVVSPHSRHHHELVHAVEFRTLGPDAHPILKEGLAEYLGSLNHTEFPPALFPSAFKAMLAESPKPLYYPAAMHFVGSLFARHGAAKFLALRAKMPKSAGLDEFAAVFEAVYEQSLDAALVEMSTDHVLGNDDWSGCGDGEAPELAWTSDDLIDTTIEATCGDPWFFGTGFVDDGRAGFYGYYYIDIPKAGQYELTVTSPPGTPPPLRGLLMACFFSTAGSGVASFGGQTGQAQLQPGSHTLVIAYPQRPEARGTATVRLEYTDPQPAPPSP